MKPITEPSKPQTLAEYLQLPPGWSAYHFGVTIEFYGPNSTTAGIYSGGTQEELIAAAAEAIKHPRRLPTI